MDCRIKSGNDGNITGTTMLKILGRKNSINVQKVMWAVGELALAHERVDIGGPFGKNKEPDYLALNPNGLVPTMQDGDFVLWESNAIVRYLARKAGKLMPSDPKAMATAEQWMDWQQTAYNPAIGPVFWNMIRTPPEKRDMALVERQKTAAIAMAQMLDAQLGRSAYVAGDSFSVGDIAVGATTFRVRALVTERPAMPNLERWYASLQQRQAFRDHIEGVPLT
jgi:glutathione S-transferase